MKFSIKKVAAAAVATGALLAMSGGSASAAPAFTINPNAIPGNTFAINPFVGTVFGGTSSELLHLNLTGNSGFGWVQLNSVSNGATVIGPLVSGLNVDYGLYLKFDLDATLLTGGNGLPGSTYKLNSLNFSVWADPGYGLATATTFTAASSAGAGTEATVGGVTVDDIFLAAGSMLPNQGTATITALGGAALNAINTFAVCTAGGTASLGGTPVALAGCTGNTGTNYFSLPNPFYQIAFSGFNNATGGVTKNGDLVAVNDAVAAITFNNVPEPGSLALLGLALAGLGATTRRKTAAK